MRMRWASRCVLGSALVLSSACASAQQTVATRRAEDPYFVTTEELRASPTMNLFDFLRARRPRWFSRYAPVTLLPTAEPGVIVYLDYARFGGVSSLRQLTTSAAVAVRFYRPTDAEAQFGVGNLGGVIQVLTRSP